MPDVRHSALVTDDPLVARISENLVFWVDERLPDIVVECTYDTGGFVDFSTASEVRLRISKYRRRANVLSLVGVATNVTPTRGQYRFVMPTASPFTSPGKYVAQITATFNGKTQRSQRFMISVEEPVA
jgi:hypothetical protein